MNRIAAWMILLFGLICVTARTEETDGITDEVRDRLRASTVYLECTYTIASKDWNALPTLIRQRIGKRPQTPASGSGFLISADGYVITNAHVVQGFVYLFQNVGGEMKANPSPDGRDIPFDMQNPENPFTLRFSPIGVQAVLYSGEEHEKKITPKIIRIGTNEDLALLKIPTSEELQFLELNADAPVDSGAKVLMSGFPGGSLPDIAPFANGDNMSNLKSRHPRVSLNSGMISAVREYQGRKIYQLDIRANHGNSGGPITDIEGRVIGVLYAGIDTMQSINYAIPAKRLKSVLPASMNAAIAGKFGSDDAGNQSFNQFLDSGKFEFNKPKK